MIEHSDLVVPLSLSLCWKSLHHHEGQHRSTTTTTTSSRPNICEASAAAAQGTSIERRDLEEEQNRNENSYYRKRGRTRDVDPGLWMKGEGPCGGILISLSTTNTPSAIDTN